ncbi:MAG: glycosyltransferase family 4 protein [Acidobacteria bacterium]|nr:glycosyltransferase family 4 protein [Acidobacteriota bacterium]MBI3658234.1 glycosyltransferase family 4 protein [Acidobacteriota bacterium]
MKPTIKFCMVTTFYPPYNFGGDGIFVYRLSNELARLGHSVDVVHCQDAYYALNRTPSELAYPNHQNIKVYGLKSSLGRLSPLATYLSGRPWLKRGPLRRILNSGGYDVIHYHNISLIGGPQILYYGTPSAIKLYTTHEYWLVCPTHVLFKNKRAPCLEPECLSCELRHKRPPQLWRYTDLMAGALKQVDAFIAPSQSVIEQHRQRGLDLPFVHIPHFLPKEQEITETIRTQLRPYFLYAGRLEKIKGVHELIRVSAQYPAADLIIVGRGDYEDTLRRCAADAPNIKFLGERSYFELKSLYAGALAVIMPSLCYEVFGMVLLEAFAAQTPVIVNDIGALTEIIAQSGGGLVYHDESTLRAAMHTLRVNSSLRLELGEKGYRAYTQFWTEDQHLKAYLGLIGDLSRRKQTSETAAEAIHGR